MSKANFNDIFIDEPLDEYVIMHRDGDYISTNVPHIVVHHSPSGYDFGNESAGSADLALNLVENLLRQIGYEGNKMVDTWSKNTIFMTAWYLHEEFKWTFIERMPIEGGKLFINELIIWVKGRVY
jgi:hypothetical protein